MTEYIERTSRWRWKQIQYGLLRRIKLLVSYLRSLMGLPGKLKDWKKSRHTQNNDFKQYEKCKKLIIFFIPGFQNVTGGVLQIFTLHRLTRKFFNEPKTDALICWIPGEGWELHHFYGFNNEVTIFSLEMVLSKCYSDCELIFHLPEYAAIRILDQIGWKHLTTLREKHALKINILNQNIERMLNRAQIDQIKFTFPELTCTVGNPVWASESERQRLNIPIHVLPTWYYPDDAPWQPYESKKNLLIVSPDYEPHRDLVLRALHKAIPELEIKVIQGLKYEQYLELEKSAKWSLTFGEGLDGYFYGPVLRGAVAFAVHNGTFDLLELEGIKTVYDNYENMAEHIAQDILALDNKEAYESYNLTIRKPLVHAFNRNHTSDSLAAYYLGEISFP